MWVPNRQKCQGCQEADRYPYLVIRLIPAVYHRLPIHFVPNDQVKPLPDSLTVVEPEPFQVDGGLTAQCRKNLIKIVRHQVKKTGHRMCLVFGSDEAVYVELDGKLYKKPEPPSGGANLGTTPG